MIVRPSVKKTIEQSLMELLQTKTIEETSVSMIAKNCGITPRAFYYHFKDKHDVVSSIYCSEMEPLLYCRLDEWYNHMGDFFHRESVFFGHTLCYGGQNCLADTIVALDWKKLKLHIKQDVRQSPEQYYKTLWGIEYMLFGNFGSLKNHFITKNDSIEHDKVFSYFNSVWEMTVFNFPPIIMENLSMTPVDTK